MSTLETPTPSSSNALSAFGDLRVKSTRSPAQQRCVEDDEHMEPLHRRVAIPPKGGIA